jgi:uncharacterized membrane protein HdeD (DUF308 family)
MEKWRERIYLIIFGCISICAGILVAIPNLLSQTVRVDILAGISIVGGVAMITVALTREPGNN